MAFSGSSSSDTVTIKYDKHSQVLIEGLWNFLATKYRVDDVAWGGGLLKAHQLILDVFLPPERLIGSVTMSSDLHCHLEALLEFLYRGTVDVKRDKVDGLLQLAKEMDFQMLVDAAVASKSGQDSKSRRKQPSKRPWEPEIEIVGVGAEGNGEVVVNRAPIRVVEPESQVVAAARRRAVSKRKTAPKSRCPECEFESSNIGVLRSHQVVVHSKGKPFKCLQCTFTTCWKGVLKHHGAILHGTKTKRVARTTQKDLPKKSTARVTRSRTITRKPKTSKVTARAPKKALPDSLVCNTCGERSRTRSGMVKHLRTHAHERPYKCPHCEKSFYQKLNRDKHAARQHTDCPGGFACKTCEMVFKTRDEIAKHRRIHARERRYNCPHCDKKFFRLSARVEHIQRAHTQGPGDYACDVCEKRFKTRAGLLEHQRIHRPERPYLCQHCGKGFNQSSALKSHVANRHGPTSTVGRLVCETCGKSMKTRAIMIEHQRIHTQERPFKCPHCEKSFIQRSGMASHIARNHTEGPGAFECETCGKRTKTRDGLVEHQRVHTQEKPFKCPQCDKGFNQSSHRSKHIKSAHTQTNESFPCETCGKVLKSRPGLIEHRRTHTQERPYKCPHCDRRFNQPSNRSQHIKKAHNPGGAPPKEACVCETCGKQVSSREALTAHRQTHNTDKMHKCPQCDYTTSIKKRIPAHMDVVHGVGPGRFTCETCGKRCQSRGLLARHILTHTKEKPFKCDQCPYAASQKGSLKTHVDAVHGEGRFRCETCDKVLRSANQLVMHRRIHTQEKPYACPHCDHRASRKYNLDNHVEVVHGHGSNKSTCDTCGETLKSARQLAHHRRAHAKEKKAREKLKPAPPAPERCPHCTHVCVDRVSLDEHVRSVHAPAHFPCDICGDRRSSMEDLADHRQSHSSAYPFDLFRFQSMHHL